MSNFNEINSVEVDNILYYINASTLEGHSYDDIISYIDSVVVNGNEVKY